MENQLSKFSSDDLDKMIDTVSGENMAGIEVFGGLLGLAAGTLTIINESWQPAAFVVGIFAVWLSSEGAARHIRKLKSK